MLAWSTRPVKVHLGLWAFGINSSTMLVASFLEKLVFIVHFGEAVPPQRQPLTPDSHTIGKHCLALFLNALHVMGEAWLKHDCTKACNPHAIVSLMRDFIHMG